VQFEFGYAKKLYIDTFDRLLHNPIVHVSFRVYICYVVLYSASFTPTLSIYAIETLRGACFSDVFGNDTVKIPSCKDALMSSS
jgi:hypothetical protein